MRYHGKYIFPHAFTILNHVYNSFFYHLGKADETDNRTKHIGK